MREELDKQLCEKYPKLFVKRDTNEPIEMFGFEHNDGWYDIVNNLCSHIQHYLNWKNKESEVVPQVRVVQVKEKFGELRFYYEGGDDYVRGLVTMTESFSGQVCEECGERGQRRSGGWIKTLCDTHELKRKYGDQY